VKDRKMILNENGKIAHDRLTWLEQQYPYIALHDFVVMPDHIHALIEINRQLIKKSDSVTMPVKIKTLGQLMGAYKTTVSKHIHLTGNKNFQWQRSFHDRVIRNHVEYYYISDYIRKNPAKWKPRAPNDGAPNDGAPNDDRQ
jgi:putative transposase